MEVFTPRQKNFVSFYGIDSTVYYHGLYSFTFQTGPQQVDRVKCFTEDHDLLTWMFFAIRFTAPDILFSAQLNKTLLFLTFRNHALVSPPTNPPFLKSRDIDVASYLLKREEIFLIFVEYVS